MTKVKICGIVEPSHALAAATAGADFIGMVFAPSKRQIDADRGRHIVLATKRLDSPPQLVGVFVNMQAEEVNRIVRYCGLDWVQLSGDEPWHYLNRIQAQVIKTIRVQPYQSTDEVVAQIEAGHKAARRRLLYLLDCHVDGAYGGTGRSFNWDIARDIARVHPIVVAGGLTPKSVGQLIREATPWGVDVSTGVETNGVKDGYKIEHFIQAVRAENGTYDAAANA
ncbi:MAG: phosphoribosylanthranilate isomerase [Chloroflexota bacterium]